MLDIYRPPGEKQGRHGLQDLPSPTLTERERFARKINIALQREPSWRWLQDFSMMLIDYDSHAQRRGYPHQFMIAKEGALHFSRRENIDELFEDPDALRITATIGPEVPNGKITYVPVIARLMPDTFNRTIETMFDHTKADFRYLAVLNKTEGTIVDQAIMIIASAGPELDNRIVDVQTHEPLRMDRAAKLQTIFTDSFSQMHGGFDPLISN